MSHLVQVQEGDGLEQAPTSILALKRRFSSPSDRSTTRRIPRSESERIRKISWSPLCKDRRKSQVPSVPRRLGLQEKLELYATRPDLDLNGVMNRLAALKRLDIWRSFEHDERKRSSLDCEDDDFDLDDEQEDTEDGKEDKDDERDRNMPGNKFNLTSLVVTTCEENDEEEEHKEDETEDERYEDSKKELKEEFYECYSKSTTAMEIDAKEPATQMYDDKWGNIRTCTYHV